MELELHCQLHFPVEDSIILLNTIEAKTRSLLRARQLTLFFRDQSVVGSLGPKEGGCDF